MKAKKMLLPKESCLENKILFKPLITNQKIGLNLRIMVEISQKMGSITLDECQSNCLSRPSCEHLTFNIKKGYCLFFTSEVAFTKVPSLDFVSSSTECIVKQMEKNKAQDATASSLENEKRNQTGNSKSNHGLSISLCNKVS